MNRVVLYDKLWKFYLKIPIYFKILSIPNKICCLIDLQNIQLNNILSNFQ